MRFAPSSSSCQRGRQPWRSRRGADSDEYVIHTNSGVIHRVLTGDVGTPPQQWTAFCPRKFGLAGHAARCGELDEHQAVCERCFPERKGQRGLEGESSAASDAEPNAWEPRDKLLYGGQVCAAAR